MAKSKVAYVCNECGAEFSRWQGQCAECKAWNTISEIRLGPAQTSKATARATGYAGQLTSQVQLMSEVSLAELPRIPSGYQELDRVLGGGIVPGSAMLIGGHPGAGKSTLLLQTMCHLAERMPVLYVTGEESLQQIAMRAHRLNLPNDKLHLLAETSVEQICHLALQDKPAVMVIDSIQVMHVADVSSAPGSVSQVREAAAQLTRFAKQHHVAIFMVGHVTKDGTLAGPKVLEHCVDCSILLEGDSDSRYRTLRCQKNRFGAINELGVFAMTQQGMREVTNPSAIFLNRGEAEHAGSVVTVIWEGTRPLLVELQALVDYTQLANPRRLAVGADHNRLAMLLAVMHRHGGVQMSDQDVFVNVVGGVKADETGVDLAVIAAMISSFRDKAIARDLLIFGEVGLSGEIRPVPSGQERLQEAAKHGFKQAIIPKANMPKQTIAGMKIMPVSHLQDVIELL